MLVPRLSRLALATVLALPATARATPIPRWDEVVARPHVPALPVPAVPKSPLAAKPYGGTRVLAIDTTLDFDPVSGALTGKLAIKLRAEAGTVSLVRVLIDSGLAISAATAPGNSVSIDSQASPPYTYATLTLGTPLATGQETTLGIDYSGTLSCSGAQNLGESACYLGTPLAYAMEGSALPVLLDQDDFGGWNVWGASRSLDLRLPTGTQALASGELVSQTDNGTTAESKWQIPGYSSIGANVLLMGKLTTLAVPGSSPSTSILTVTGSDQWAGSWQDWMKTILPFIGAQSGKSLPYSSLRVMKLPLGWTKIFRGSAGHALTMLSEDYAAGGAGYFEETLAHENSHQWWGVLVSPTDVLTTRWLTEGLATMSQIDYSASKLPAAEREAYIARRYREHWLLVRYLGDASLPTVVSNPQAAPADTIPFTIWAYIRSSALLQHLRVVLGDEVFAQILKTWANQCDQALCDTADFEQIVQTATPLDMKSFFDQWVWAGGAVEPAIGFGQTGGKLQVSASGIDGLTLPLELFVTLESGEVVKKQVVLSGSTPVSIDVTGSVRSVRPNPRQDGFVWSHSAVTGDLDFDAEVDGLDVIHAAWRVGKTSATGQPGGEGVWSEDLDFDPRLDADGDGEITDADLAVVTGEFGNVKGAP